MWPDCLGCVGSLRCSALLEVTNVFLWSLFSRSCLVGCSDSARLGLVGFRSWRMHLMLVDLIGLTGLSLKLGGSFGSAVGANYPDTLAAPLIEA